MDKQSQYQKYRETILAYGKTRVECECGETLNRNSLSRHRKTQKHKDKVQGSDPNSIEWFLEGYGSEGDEEEEPPKCVDCDNIASINEYYPNGDYEEKYWTLCKECFKKDQEESESEEVKCGICEKKIEDTSKCDYNDDIGEYCCKEANCLRKFWGDEEEEEEEEEILLEKGTFTKDIVFQCSGCFESIIRDSKKHNECQIIKNSWVCGDCY
jgi:hypothetical protein